MSTVFDPQRLAAQACLVGATAKVRCTYEYDRKLGSFAWHYFRRGTLVGTTVDPKKVIKKMERYSTCK